ncbi:hypothetical protein CBFG_01916 [Clostridiales bacterium 1_7_47FAA]|nr:hypothetical protein CBFG_01916 [Clostridiales bacterium 1_7_47FAA]
MEGALRHEKDSDPLVKKGRLRCWPAFCFRILGKWGDGKWNWL